MARISHIQLHNIIRDEAAKLQNENRNVFFPESTVSTRESYEPKGTVINWDAGYLITSNKENIFQNLFLEIDKASWSLFEKNKNSAANSINIFSPSIAAFLESSNLICNRTNFKTDRQYSEDKCFFIGTLIEKYKVYLIKQITRKVLFEKLNSKPSNEEFFIKNKWNVLELFSEKYPEEIITIKLNNI